jgi:transcriptional regulator NrdR family protein
MRCLLCKGKLKAYDSRPNEIDNGQAQMRRHKCKKCSAKYKTVEELTLDCLTNRVIVESVLTGVAHWKHLGKLERK